MEESDTINVAAGSARTQHPSSIQIRIQIDGSVVQSDRKPSGSSQIKEPASTVAELNKAIEALKGRLKQSQETTKDQQNQIQ